MDSKDPKINLKEVLSMQPLFHPREKDRSISIPEFTTEDMTLDAVAKALSNIDSLSDNELFEMIHNNYKLFLSDTYLLDYNYRQTVIDIFSDERFLTVLNKVLSQEILSDKIITCCNKVTWDYMSQQNSKNEEVSKKLLELSDTVNKTIVSLLSAFIPVPLARNIAIARYSSFKMMKNIQRANFMIVKYGNNISVQDIVNVYGIIYRYTRLTTVFLGIMFDLVTTDKPDELERAGKINTAIIEILERGMSEKDIALILNNYANELAFEPRRVRFSLFSCNAQDYPRINKILQTMSQSIP